MPPLPPSHRGNGTIEPGSKRSVAALCLLLLACDSRAAGVEDWIQSFAQSDFRFNRSTSNAPFAPLAWASYANYGNTDFSVPGSSGARISYRQASLSEAAMVPVLINSRDALVVGEWASLTRFNTDSATLGEFDALSISVPLGWGRQASEKWQYAALVAPMGHKASLGNSPWYWEYLGGAFARYTASDSVSWVYGLYVDLSPVENFYIPYVGANWIINPKWTLCAIMPWPAVLYAPTADTFFRFGVAPTGSSWALQPKTNQVELNLDAWNLGVSMEHRVHGRLWARIEAGISGMRGISISSGQLNNPDSGLGTAPYVSVGITFRPAMR